jgi:hypothetical protein
MSPAIVKSTHEGLAAGVEGIGVPGDVGTGPGKAELTGGGPTGYVVLRVDEGEYTSPNCGRSLRMLGFKALGVWDLAPAAADASPWC